MKLLLRPRTVLQRSTWSTLIAKCHIIVIGSHDKRHGSHNLNDHHEFDVSAITGSGQRPKRSSLAQVFQENGEREGHWGYLETPESFVPALYSSLRTISSERCITGIMMWYSRLPGMWTRDFKFTSNDWGVGTSLVSGRSIYFARHKCFLVSSKLAENDYAFPNTDQLSLDGPCGIPIIIILLQTVIEEVRHRFLCITVSWKKRVWMFRKYGYSINEYRLWAVHCYSTTTFWSKKRATEKLRS